MEGSADRQMPEDAKGPATRAAPEIELAGPSGRGVGHLGPILAWAVVFADLGTSTLVISLSWLGERD